MEASAPRLRDGAEGGGGGRPGRRRKDAARGRNVYFERAGLPRTKEKGKGAEWAARALGRIKAAHVQQAEEDGRTSHAEEHGRHGKATGDGTC
eukprot:6961203-Pyramimonas_sp.AAC.1